MSDLDRDEHHNNQLRPAAREYKNASFALWRNVLEIIEITGFIIPYVFNPIEGFRAFFPTMGASSFNPETDIGDLSGKVILVTGGESSPKIASSFSRMKAK
jgi:hypothetical protein